ncbi:4Fe-4S binding protein [Clostridium sp. JS66]|uniref:4Fe-4S binding protein n=1 Tax=Clostridium sp. JS66 TaxID=3064705 RepID=UPI00298E6B7E|nr:4Fe-4S binding protein [Clostridium sp. JS66]WPC43920.1 4Fe-4S binding protein [Clostridium sp. JS66]
MRQKIRNGILVYSALLFPLSFLFISPFIIILSALNGVVNGSAVIFGILFLFSLVGSRLFCGWLCPGGAIQDYISISNGRPWNSKWKNVSKYIIWVIWLSFIIFLWMIHRPLKVKFFYMTGIEIIFVIIYFIVMTIIYVFTIVTGKRGMCHSLCWMAPFMVIGEKTADFLHIPRFRLKVHSEACISCGQCNKQCPMGLDVHEMVKNGCADSPECISCLKCVDICPKKAISCGISGLNKKTY